MTMRDLVLLDMVAVNVMTTNDKVQRILVKMPKYELAKELSMTHKTLNARIENDTWKKLEIEKINKLCQ